MQLTKSFYYLPAEILETKLEKFIITIKKMKTHLIGPQHKQTRRYRQNQVGNKTLGTNMLILLTLGTNMLILLTLGTNMFILITLGTNMLILFDNF